MWHGPPVRLPKFNFFLPNRSTPRPPSLSASVSDWNYVLVRSTVLREKSAHQQRHRRRLCHYDSAAVNHPPAFRYRRGGTPSLRNRSAAPRLPNDRWPCLRKPKNVLPPAARCRSSASFKDLPSGTPAASRGVPTRTLEEFTLAASVPHTEERPADGGARCAHIGRALCGAASVAAGGHAEQRRLEVLGSSTCRFEGRGSCWFERPAPVPPFEVEARRDRVDARADRLWARRPTASDTTAADSANKSDSWSSRSTTSSLSPSFAGPFVDAVAVAGPAGPPTAVAAGPSSPQQPHVVESFRRDVAEFLPNAKRASLGVAGAGKPPVSQSNADRTAALSITPGGVDAERRKGERVGTVNVVRSEQGEVLLSHNVIVVFRSPSREVFVGIRSVCLRFILHSLIGTNRKSNSGNAPDLASDSTNPARAPVRRSVSALLQNSPYLIRPSQPQMPRKWDEFFLLRPCTTPAPPPLPTRNPRLPISLRTRVSVVCGCSLPRDHLLGFPHRIQLWADIRKSWADFCRRADWRCGASGFWTKKFWLGMRPNKKAASIRGWCGNGKPEKKW